MALAVLGLAAACGGKGSGGDPTPTPTPVVLPRGSGTFTSWTVSPARPGAVDLRELTDQNLQAIRETVERYEALRMEWECTLSLEGLPMREVATEQRIAGIEQYLAKKREEGLCEVIEASYVAYYTVLQADRASVYAEYRGVSRFFDPATGEEAKPAEPFDHALGIELRKGDDGRWRIDRFFGIPKATQSQ